MPCPSLLEEYCENIFYSIPALLFQVLIKMKKKSKVYDKKITGKLSTEFFYGTAKGGQFVWVKDKNFRSANYLNWFLWNRI